MKCNYCNEIDTLEHHLIHCIISRQIWDHLIQWISDKLMVKYSLTECEILFGIPFMNSVDLQIINFLILFTKWFINQKRTSKLHLYFIEVLSGLKAKIETIMQSNTLNSRQHLEWQVILKDSL